jgi:antibiotic biosynthesis monooxygenase (ABM) superfamily enzyme
MSELLNTDDLPVTIAVSRRVKPGCEAEFEEIIAGITKAAMTFDGHLGTNIFRPINSADPEYLVIFKFDRMSNLRRWQESEVRRKWLARAETLTLCPPVIQILTGLETWFTLSTQQAIVPPPRYKIALVTWLAVFPLISVINMLFGSVLNQLPLPLRSLVLTVALVSLMTYVIMPQMTRVFARWLYPSTQQSHKRLGRRYGKKRK